MVKLYGKVANVTELTEENKLRMFALMESHYNNINSDTFYADLREKRWAILLSDSEQRIQGFTTLMTMDFDIENKKVKFLFSGDTIIHRDFWGSTELHRVWGRFALQCAADCEDELFYWLLISKGYKTYRFLSTYFNDFYPRYAAATPEFEKKLIDHFGKYKYPEFYDPDKGVVKFDMQKDCLKSGIADVTERRLKDPHVEFFVRQNPGHIRGDELVCIARLSRDNMKPFVQNHFLESI